MEQIPELFWTSIMVWAYAEIASIVRIAFTEDKENILDDRILKYFVTTRFIGLYASVGFGIVIILVSAYNIVFN